MAKSTTAFASRDHSRSVAVSPWKFRHHGHVGSVARCSNQGSVCNHVSSHMLLYYEDPHHLALVRRQIREPPGKEGDLPPPSS